MWRVTRLLVMFVGCFLLLQLLEFALSSNTCESHHCQNGGQCIGQNSAVDCVCPCNYAGKHCEVKDWCPDATFSKIGCVVNQSDNEVLFHAKNTLPISNDLVWNRFLDNITCSCALAAKENAFRFFFLGENGVCAGSNEAGFSSLKESADECHGKAPNRSTCNDENTLVACVGSSGHEYVYELFEKDRQCATSDMRDCNDYDYVVRMQSVDNEHYFGPIKNGLPTGKPFTVCVWQRFPKKIGQYMYPTAYSISGSGNHFTAGIHIVDASYYDLIYYVRDEETKYRFGPKDITDKWIHFCSVANFPQNYVATFIDGEEFHRFAISASALSQDGYLIIGRDQDKYWGAFGPVDVFVGEITQYNVWDFPLNSQEIRQLHEGTGTETGNFLAWTDLKTYLHGPTAISGSPVMKWTGKGCKWENWQCNDGGLCQGATFRCPCNGSALAPRSCTSSTMYKMKPCSDYDYVLEIAKPSILVFDNNLLHWMSAFSICTWIKVPPSLKTSYSLIKFINKPLLQLELNFVLNEAQMFKVKHGNTQTWPASSDISNNEWKHLCLIKNRYKIDLFENGISQGVKVFDNLRISGDTIMLIGDPDDDQGEGFTLSYAHFNIWSSVLSQSVVSSLAEGAGTVIGNILSWPTLKQSVHGSIKVQSSFPKMKWADTSLNCNWTDSTCRNDQRCEGAALICPAVHLDDVAPQSCLVSSFIPIRKTKRTNWRDDVMDAVLVSRGKHDQKHITYSGFFLNDVEVKTKGLQGMHFRILNAKTGLLRKILFCNTHGWTYCGQKITDAFRGLYDEVIVLMVIFNSGSGHYADVVAPLTLALGSSVNMRGTIHKRGGMTLIGYHGSKDVTWGSLKISKGREGPTVTKTTIPLVRESCLEHLYMGAKEDGKYVIYPGNGPEMTVFCEFTTNGGGWTVFQRRHKGEVTFARNLGHYRHGFGSVDGEFWLGNENLHRLGRGQLLVRLTSTGDDSTYSLYDRFDVSSEYTLFAEEKSGLISDGIFGGNSSVELSFAAYDKSESTIDKCFNKFDGGWWFGANCSGMNLNADKQKCNTSYLSYEMMTRERPRSTDVVIKTVANTISYVDAMEICEKDDMRLCTASEICVDGTTPVGGVISGEHWAPVFDTYNQWIQVGDSAGYDLCSFFNLDPTSGFPSWGENNNTEVFKGKLFCCASALASKGMVMNTLPGSLTYDDAKEACSKINKRLCNSGEICPDQDLLLGRIFTGDHWVPVAEKDNKWLHAGDYHKTCTTAVNEDWMNGNKPYKGKVFCCDFPKANGIELKTMTNTMSYTEGNVACQKNGKRLCSSAEICVDGRTPHGGIITGDHFVPVSNRYNEWMSVGSHRMTCVLHSIDYNSNPNWGLGDMAAGFKKHLFCCDFPEARGILLKHMATTTSYENATHGCWEENKRLCSQREICADGFTPYGGPFSGRHWAPVLDKYNEWVHVGEAKYYLHNEWPFCIRVYCRTIFVSGPEREIEQFDWFQSGLELEIQQFDWFRDR